MAIVGISVTENNKVMDSPYLLQETEDIYQNFIKLNANIPSRTKALKMLS